ncbi:MAG: N4-gp56 family major capsid protein [Planctomycetota bacterium]|jgi:N4-gp56 family major capsid protein
MANEVTTTSTLTRGINAMFMRRFLERGQYHTHYFEGTMPGQLNTMQGTNQAFWRRYDEQAPTTTALTELTDNTLPTRTASKPSITDVLKVVAKYGDFFLISEEAELYNFNGQTAELLDVLAQQAGRSVNQVVRNEMEDNPTLLRGGGGASDGTVTAGPTAAELNQLIQTLNANVAMPFEPISTTNDTVASTSLLPSYLAICSVYQAYNFSKLTGFKSVETYANHVAPFNREFGYFPGAGFGVRFIQSADASLDTGQGGSVGSTGLRSTSGQVDLYTCVIYGQRAVGTLGFGNTTIDSIQMAEDATQLFEIISHPRGSSGVADALNETATLGWKAWVAAKILQPTWIRGYRTGATLL